MSKTIATRQASMPEMFPLSAEMFSPSSVKRNPEGIIRVIEVTLPQISSWLTPHNVGQPAKIRKICH